MSTLKPYTGAHWLIEFHGATGLDDLTLITHLLSEAATASGARVLRVDTHHFGERSGIAGIALLAESHISIHTWPELSYAAIDVFLCGRDNRPEAAVDVLRNALTPLRETIQVVKRGYGVLA
jgi:S-adenosylmethionine decarboxylase